MFFVKTQRSPTQTDTTILSVYSLSLVTIIEEREFVHFFARERQSDSPRKTSTLRCQMQAQKPTFYIDCRKNFISSPWPVLYLHRNKKKLKVYLKKTKLSFQNLSFNLFKIPYRERRDHFAINDWENPFSPRREYLMSGFVNTVRSSNEFIMKVGYDFKIRLAKLLTP
jgi:hypothetical protein